MKNPLLQEGDLPRFGEIRPEHVVPALTTLLDGLGRELDRLESEASPTWGAVVEPIERIGDRLGRVWGVAGHLMAVRDSEELRAAYETVQPQVVAFSTRLGQSRPLYDALQSLRAGEGWSTLDDAQRRIVELMLLDAELSGVGLAGAERERFNAIQTEQAELATRFSNHVLDATREFALVLDDPADIDGLPRSLLELAAQAQRTAQPDSNATAERGPWRFTLEAPSWLPFMQHGRRRKLRERMYRTYLTRASQGERDNRTLITRILALRREEAVLLGYPNYAAMSLSSKMAPDVPAVERLLEELRAAAYPAAQREMEELREFARAAGAPEAEDLQHWDVAFWAERMREERYAYRDEELRPYFPLPRVLEGLFTLAKGLFEVEVVAADGEAEAWHDDVRFFHVRDARGERIASFFLDAYSRPSEKRGGAWMDECVGRARVARRLRLPVAYLVCNGTPPIDGKPSLMTFREVETLFHEFGHCLQHMLTTVDYGMASGIRYVEWDAIELASQFMENWCYHRETLTGFSGHYESGEPLPQQLFEKISAARTYRAGSLMLRQLYFSLLDLELHKDFEPPDVESVFALQRRVAEGTTILPPLPEDRFLCSFEHVFSGGYAAGYYSYKWAEVLSADAFAAFEEPGLEEDSKLREIGRRYRDTILAFGGSRPPMDVFCAFRGRAPTTEALLRHSGLAA